MKKILTNKSMCRVCGDVIESKYRHDFRFCKCGSIAVDGGKDYLKRSGEPVNHADMSQYERCKDCGTEIEWKAGKPFTNKGCWCCPNCKKEVQE